MPPLEPPRFPIRFRGYDRAAVDAHLRELADELQARTSTVAVTASEQVRAVLSAAETSAAEIVAGAERDAARIRELAGRTGDDVAERVASAASDALTRIDALRGDLETLLGALGEREEERPSPDLEPEPLVPDPEAPGEAPEKPEDPDRLVPDPDAPDPDAEEGARIVALDLALSGTPRVEADRFLAEHFRLHDRHALLDDVYASAGG